MDESTVEHSEDIVEATEVIEASESVDDPQGSVEEPAQAVSNYTGTDEAIVEAVLFTSDTPLPPAKIAAATELPPRRIKKAVTELNKRYAKGGHAFRIEDIAGGYQMMTLPEFHDVLRRLLNVKKDSRLSQAAMETLAIVAYRQPILRADIEAIRGVASGEVLRGLLERQLVKIVGRAEVIGRPMLYGTSKRFLEIFGLASLDDLPRVEELRSGAEKSSASPAVIAEESITSKDEQVVSSDSSTEANPMSKKKPDDDFIPDPDEVEEEEEEFLDDEEDEEFDDDDEEFDDEEFDDDDDEEFDDDDDDEEEVVDDEE